MNILEKASQIVIEFLDEKNIQKDSDKISESLIIEFLELILLDFPTNIFLKNKINNILNIVKTQHIKKNIYLTNIRILFLTSLQNYNKSQAFFVQNIDNLIDDIKNKLIYYLKTLKE